MKFDHKTGVRLLIASLILVPFALVSVKVLVWGYEINDILPHTQYEVVTEIGVDGHEGQVRVRTFLPLSDGHQAVTEEENTAPGLHLSTKQAGLNREAVWLGREVPDGAKLRYRYRVLGTRMRFELDPEIEVPGVYPASVAGALLPEEEIQVDHPEVQATLREIGAHSGTLRERLEAIFARTSGMPQRPFKGTTDALTALRLGEASCNGKSRLFVALARAAGIPARLVGGLILEAGSKRTGHQWAEAYVAGHWVPFGPTNGYFAELPSNYLALYRGDESLFRHTADINFDYRFNISAYTVPSPKAKLAFERFNLWALFERLGLSFALLRTLLLLPVGALVVVVFRNVIGMPTFGTFLPALIAAGAGATGPVWGIVGMVVVVGAVALARWFVGRLRLLHSPTLGILLTVVTVTLLLTSLFAEQVGLLPLAHVTLFPIAVLAITAERFFLALTERGPLDAAKDMTGTAVVIAACYVVMNSLALQMLVLGFPELLLLVVAANIYLGRWVGIRVSEYLRFRHLLFGGGGEER